MTRTRILNQKPRSRIECIEIISEIQFHLLPTKARFNRIGKGLPVDRIKLEDSTDSNMEL